MQFSLIPCKLLILTDSCGLIPCNYCGCGKTLFFSTVITTMRKFKSMNETEIKSGNAVQDCIRMLSQSPMVRINAKAIMHIGNPQRSMGTVSLAFENFNPPQFPIVTFDSDQMRGYGIEYSTFDPNRGDQFTFHPGKMELSVVSGKHSFSLSEIRINS